MRWRLILEEFGPDIKHIKSEDNVVAYTISQLLMSEMSEIEDEFLAQEKVLEAEFPLDLHLVLDRTENELNEVNSTLKKLINDKNPVTI